MANPGQDRRERRLAAIPLAGVGAGPIGPGEVAE
jgi:hypothetical protein